MCFALAAVVGLLSGPAAREYRGDSDDDQIAEDAWRLAATLVALAPKGVIER
jgi:hypothetical protein